MTGPPDTDPIAALGGLVERVARQAEATAARTEEHEQHIRGLADAVQSLARPGLRAPAGPGPLSWLAPARADDDRPGPDLAEHLADLAAWVGQVYLRYHGARLPSCWLWHPAVVEELTWLRGAHIEAYTGRAAGYGRVGVWHEQQRPGVARRIEEWIGACELSEHLPDREHGDSTEPVAPLSEHLDHVAETWAHTQTVPAPTPRELAAAAALHATPGRRP